MLFRWIMATGVTENSRSLHRITSSYRFTSKRFIRRNQEKSYNSLRIAAHGDSMM